MKRTTIVLPDDLHERLRQEAFRGRISLSRLIRTRLEARRGRGAQPGKTSEPLREVEGIGADGQLTKDLDEALYGI